MKCFMQSAEGMWKKYSICSAKDAHRRFLWTTKMDSPYSMYVS